MGHLQNTQCFNNSSSQKFTRKHTKTKFMISISNRYTEWGSIPNYLNFRIEVKILINSTLKLKDIAFSEHEN